MRHVPNNNQNDVQRELIDNILSLNIAFPKACSQAIIKQLESPDGILGFIVLCQKIGISYSQQIFELLGSAQWTRIQSYKTHRDDIKNDQALVAFYMNLLAESMDWDTSQQQEDEPFSFLKSMDAHSLTTLLNAEDATDLALISLYWSFEEMSKILSCLDPQKRRLTVLQITRLSEKIAISIQPAAERYSERLFTKKNTLESLLKKLPTPPPYPKLKTHTLPQCINSIGHSLSSLFGKPLARALHSKWPWSE